MSAQGVILTALWFIAAGLCAQTVWDISDGPARSMALLTFAAFIAAFVGVRALALWIREG